MRRAVWWIAPGLLLAVTVGVSAQEHRNVPEPGSYGVAFDLPGGGGAGLGLRKMLSPSANLGIGVVADYRKDERERPPDTDDSSTSWSLGLRPDLRLYRAVTESILPFLSIESEIAYHEQSSGTFDRSGIELGLGLGVGAEWFPVEGASIAGVTGVDVSYRRQTLEPDMTDRTFAVGLFRSRLSLNLYF